MNAVNMRAKRSTLMNALFAAREIYLADALAPDLPERIRYSFVAQAEECKRVCDEIEQADIIHLED